MAGRVVRSFAVRPSPHAVARLTAELTPAVVLVLLLAQALIGHGDMASLDTDLSRALGAPARGSGFVDGVLHLVSWASVPVVGWVVGAERAAVLGRGRYLRARRRPSRVAWAFEWGSARAPLWGPSLGIAITVAVAELLRLALLALVRSVEGDDARLAQTFAEHHVMTVTVVVAAVLTAHGVRRRGTWVLAVATVALVAWARVAVAGLPVSGVLSAAALGAGAVVAGRAGGLLTDGPVWNLVQRRHRRKHPPQRRKAGVIINPSKFADPESFRRRVESALSGDSAVGTAEVFDVEFYETTVDDPGRSMTRQALDDGVDLLVAAGGDGTVRTVCTASAGSGVHVGVIPVGTSNLLARNLRIPLQENPALDVAAGGVDRAIDLARIEGDGLEEADGFVVMAGLGLDGAIMADVPDLLKKVLGLPAYVVTGARHLRDAPFEVEVTVDDRPPITRMVRMVVVGNVGSVQVFELLPGAVPDDGLLDVVIVAPKTNRSFLRVLWNVAWRSKDPDVEQLKGRTVRLRSDGTVPRQLDGDVIPSGADVRITIDPGSVIVRVPNRR